MLTNTLMAVALIKDIYMINIYVHRGNEYPIDKKYQGEFHCKPVSTCLSTPKEFSFAPD